MTLCLGPYQVPPVSFVTSLASSFSFPLFSSASLDFRFPLDRSTHIIYNAQLTRHRNLPHIFLFHCTKNEFHGTRMLTNVSSKLGYGRSMGTAGAVPLW